MRSRHVVPQDHSHTVFRPVEPRISDECSTDGFERPSRTLTVHTEHENQSQQIGM